MKIVTIFYSIDDLASFRWLVGWIDRWSKWKSYTQQINGEFSFPYSLDSYCKLILKRSHIIQVSLSVEISIKQVAPTQTITCTLPSSTHRKIPIRNGYNKFDEGKTRSEWTQNKRKTGNDVFSGRARMLLLLLLLVVFCVFVFFSRSLYHFARMHSLQQTVSLAQPKRSLHSDLPFECSMRAHCKYSWDVCRCFVFCVVLLLLLLLKAQFLWHRYIFWFACVML